MRSRRRSTPTTGATGVTASYDSSSGNMTTDCFGRPQHRRLADHCRWPHGEHGSERCRRRHQQHGERRVGRSTRLPTRTAVANTAGGHRAPGLPSDRITLSGAGAVGHRLCGQQLSLGNTALNGAECDLGGRSPTRRSTRLTRRWPRSARCAARLGAMQSRFESVITSVQTASENLSRPRAAASRMRTSRPRRPS